MDFAPFEDQGPARFKDSEAFGKALPQCFSPIVRKRSVFFYCASRRRHIEGVWRVEYDVVKGIIREGETRKVCDSIGINRGLCSSRAGVGNVVLPSFIGIQAPGVVLVVPEHSAPAACV